MTNDANPNSAQPLRYSRVYSDTNGDSHFSDQELVFAPVAFSPHLPPVLAATPVAVRRLVGISAPGGGEADWHPVPRRQFNIVLSGEVEIEASSGEKRRFGSGSIILGEDTEGRGHFTRVVSEEDAYFMVIAIGEDSE